MPVVLTPNYEDPYLAIVAEVVARRILAEPENKLTTDAAGQVTATNGSGATVNVTTETTALRTA